MEKRWIVIAVTDGDVAGSDSYNGFRVWSQVFNTHAAADLAYKFLKETIPAECRCTIIEDFT